MLVRAPVSVLAPTPTLALARATVPRWATVPRRATVPATVPAKGGLRIRVNRDFLLDALAAGAQDQLVLELDGPITPLAVRVPGRETFSLLMPVRR